VFDEFVHLKLCKLNLFKFHIKILKIKRKLNSPSPIEPSILTDGSWSHMTHGGSRAALCQEVWRHPNYLCTDKLGVSGGPTSPPPRSPGPLTCRTGRRCSPSSLALTTVAVGSTAAREGESIDLSVLSRSSCSHHVSPPRSLRFIFLVIR
jgi:hypothetical protein